MIREDPIRVKIKVRDISKIRGFVEIFLEKDGYDIKFLPEATSGRTTTPKDHPPKKPDGDSEEEEDDSRENELEWDRMRKKYEKDNQQEGNGGQKRLDKSSGKQMAANETPQYGIMDDKADEKVLKIQGELEDLQDIDGEWGSDKPPVHTQVTNDDYLLTHSVIKRIFLCSTKVSQYRNSARKGSWKGGWHKSCLDEILKVMGVSRNWDQGLKS